MSIIDKQLLFADKVQDLAAQSETDLGDTIDLARAVKLGNGTVLRAFACATEKAGTTPTIQIKVYGDNAANFASKVCVFDTGALDTAVNVPTRVEGPIADAVAYRYYKAMATVVGTNAEYDDVSCGLYWGTHYPKAD